jgi:hypothetical protein
LNFASGDLSKTFTVPICDDAVAETSETVNLALSSPTGAVLGAQNTAVLTITDNDSAPTLQFSSATYSAAENVAGGIITLTVTRAGATGNAVSVDYGTGGGTATAGACAPGVDYNTASGTLNFAAGDTSKTFNVTICNDSVYELNQTFNATLTNPTGGATIGTPNPATATITNDDAAPTVAINDITLAEGNAGTTNFQTTFTVTGANEVAGGFSFQTADNTATSPSDYTAIASTPAVIPANVNRTTATLNGSIVLVNGDTTPEINETFFLNGSTCTDCSFTDNQGVATITNDDSTLQFSTATSSVSEGAGTATLTVTRNGLGFPVTVDYSLGGGTATGGGSCGVSVDYVNTGGTLNFAANDASKTINVTICDDATLESPETFVATLSNATGGAVIIAPTTQTVTINDNDGDNTAPVITYTPIANNPITTVLSTTITDAVGVTGANIFWSINGGSFTSAACTPAGGTPQNGTWSCPISGTSNPNAVAYYVTATDAALNVGSNPSGGASAPNLFTIGAATVPAGNYTHLRLGSGVVLGGNVFVNSSLNLNGIVDTGAFKLSLNCNVPVTGGGEFSYIVGTLERLFCGVESFTFNVGAPLVGPRPTDGTLLAPEGTLASNYSPLAVNITGGTVGSSLTVKVFDSALAGFDPARSISRNWSIEESGDLTAGLAFTYRNEDVNGNESDYRVYRYPGTGMITNLCPAAPCVDTATNTASVSNVSVFSRWTVAELLVPTAAPVSLSGRVTDAYGRGIRNALITVEGGGMTEPRVRATGSFGYYDIDGLSIGTYIVTVGAQRHTFTVPSRAVTMLDNVTGVDFVAEPQE